MRDPKQLNSRIVHLIPDTQHTVVVILVLNLQEAEKCFEHIANINFTLQSRWNHHITLNDGIKMRETSIICSHFYLTVQPQLQKPQRKKNLTN